MSLHHEIAFERAICEHLGANGWLSEEGSSAAYSRELALYPPDLIGWVQEARPEAWDLMQKKHGVKAEATLLQRVRQVRYSTRNENCLDLVLILNGIPVATAELKTDNTQNIADAVWQCKTDRLPKAAGQAPEPVLSFPSGALEHFAVSNREVQMTTRLKGPRTQFLPFNQGSDPGGPGCGAGNPVMAGRCSAPVQ